MPRVENESVIILWIWIGIGLLFLTTLFIAVLVTNYIKNIKKNKQKVMQMFRSTQTEYRENAISFQEKDRERLAEELHDNIISRLNLIRLNAHQKNPDELNSDLKNSMQLIREFTHNLTPPDLNDIELTDLIADYLEQLKVNIDVHFYQITLNKIALNSSTKLHIFRILQELINNTLKHAEASQIKVFVRTSKQYLILIAEDNGTGFTTGNHSGIGLRSIHLRTKQINAFYKLKTKPQRGTKWIIFVNNQQ